MEYYQKIKKEFINNNTNKEVKEYLDKKITKEEMIEKIKQETRRYAKRQLTWFKKNKNTIWLEASLGVNKNLEIILENIKDSYNSQLNKY